MEISTLQTFTWSAIIKAFSPICLNDHHFEITSSVIKASHSFKKIFGESFKFIIRLRWRTKEGIGWIVNILSYDQLCLSIHIWQDPWKRWSSKSHFEIECFNPRSIDQNDQSENED